VQIWDSVNVSLNPELKAKLFEGNLNIFTCDQCSHTRPVLSSVLYHDMHRGFAVQFFPDQFLEDDEFYNRWRDDDPGMGDVVRTMKSKIPRHLAHPHIVFDLDELKRYVAFRERLFEMVHVSSVDKTADS
jgi:hypothetical protein